MPIIQTDGGYIYKTIKKRTNSKARFLVLLFFCSLAIIAGIFYLFTKVDFAGVFNLNKFQIFEEKNYYAVCVNSGDDFSYTSQFVNDIKMQGGAGFVLTYHNQYYLVANIYDNLSDAENVSQSINGIDTQVLTIKLNKLVLSKSFDTQQINTLKNSLNCVNKAYENLYNLSLCLDKGELLDAEVKQKLQVFKETCQQDKEMLSQAFQNNFESIVTRAKIFASELVTNIIMLQSSQNLSSDIKYTLASTISSFLQLQQNVTKN